MSKGKKVKPWQQYQHDTADLLRELGFTAVVDDQIEEPNGTVHNVDVSARKTLAGVSVLWVVECKHWNKRIPKEKVAALIGIVSSVGADRGLLMSEKGFQSGAVRMAGQKNITLSGVADLRANAAEEILATRFGVAEKRLMSLSLRVERDMKPNALQMPRMLVAFAARLRPEDVEEFARRPAAVDLMDGITEIYRRIEGFTVYDHLDYLTPREQLSLEWRPGVDADVMEGASVATHYLTHALYGGRLGHWPVFAPDADRTVKLSWSMPQLLDVVEPSLERLERIVAEEDEKAAKVPKPPWPHKTGMLPPPPLSRS